MEISATQLRMARVALDWTADKLAEVSGVSVSSIRNFESPKRSIRMMAANRREIQRVLEERGVAFVWPKTGQAGVLFTEETEAVDNG